jgi:F-type H+-transporting ATPase subunit delta
MRGASRASLAELSEQLDAAIPPPATSRPAPARAETADKVGDELFAVVRLLDSEHGLRRALADPAKPSREKAEVVRRLLHGQVSAETEDLVAAAAAARWGSPGDLADAIEELAIEALTLAAQLGGTLDDLEDDLFRFSRLVAGQPGLREALVGPAGPDAKRSLLTDLLGGKVSGPSLSLITQVLTHTRGRSPQAALDVCAGIAARRREQLIAVVRAATELTAEQRRRLVAILTEAYGQGIHLNVVHDPTVIGGMSVKIGDELIDGTAATRLAEVRRRLAG